MIKEYYKYIKDYLKVSETKKSYSIYMILTAAAYKIFLLLNTLFASWIIKYATNKEFKMTYISIGLLFISYLLNRIFHHINYKIYGKNMINCFGVLQTKVLNKLLTVDENFTKYISKGKLINTVNTDITNIGDISNRISELITTIIQIIAIWIIVSFHNISIGIIFIIFSVIYIIVRDYTDKKSVYYFSKQKYHRDKYSNLLSQTLSGLQEIKTFNMIPKLKLKLSQIQKKYSDAYMKKRKYVTIKESDIKFISYSFKILIYIILLLLLILNKTEISILVLIIGYFETIDTYMDSLISATSAIRETNVSVERINNILEYKTNNDITYGNINNDSINGIIDLIDVKFKYTDKEIIKGINLKIESNTITMLVGQSGTGKTSIFNMLLRIYKPTSGKILIDGVDIFEYSKDIYKSNVSVVNQKPFIFNMSIRKNLDFVDQNINNQIEACKRVGIHDFISSLPQGYNTILRENANNISGGQKQLISLARTLLSKSEILLFDEITSSLDPETETNIDKILKDLKKDHTILMITHKPELMKKADRIIVLHEGKIVGDGTHEDLIENNTYYQNLQSRKSASKIGVFNND